MTHPQNISSKLLYLQVAAKARVLILEQKLKPHDPVPSEGELAKRFAVSRMTSRLALEQLVKEGIVYRLARRGTFLSPGGGLFTEEASSFQGESLSSPVPLLPAAGGAAEKATGAQRQFAVVFSHLSDYTSRILAGLEMEARKNGYDLIVKLSQSEADEDDCLRHLSQGRVQGIILFPQGRVTCSDEILRLKFLRYPLVIIDRIFREVELDCVYHDHCQGSCQMVRYLIGKGHTAIGYASNPIEGITSREERYQGYMKALLDSGIPVDNRLIFFHETPVNPAALTGKNPQAAEFLARNKEMTAVMCGDDNVAISTLYTAMQMGIAVPGQLSVAGFTDLRMAELLPVSLTTVRQPTANLAQAAFQLLQKRMDGSQEKPLTIKIPTAIVERKSVSPYPMNGRTS